MNLFICTMVLSIACIARPSGAAPYKELVPGFNRTKSPVMVRSIDVPTLANLDYAAYAANPIRFDPEKQRPKRPAKKVTIGEMTFNGALVKAVSTIAGTPLTKDELDHPIAWAPLMNLLWTGIKADGLQKIGATIIGEKWNDPDIFKPYQDIAALYLHATGGGKTEFWVKIEFMPWVPFLQGIDDADKDGFKEIYGLLNAAKVDSAQGGKTVAFIDGDYRRKLLTNSEITDWANVLASYWYPTLNTDLVDMSAAVQWPTGRTEPRVRAALKKLTVKTPAAVIRGNPYGKALYNVFVVNGLDETPAPEKAPAASPVRSGLLDSALSANFQENDRRFTKELQPWGDYPAWVRALAPVRDGVEKALAGVPKDQMGIVGNDGWLFFRKSIDYILAPDLSLQPPDKNPIPRLLEFKAYLDKNNINFLFVAVPCKEEIYCDKLGVRPSKGSGGIIAPYGRKFLADLQKSGIEVMDLLPLFLEAKAADTLSTEPVYQKQDTHWTTRGLDAAAALLAERIGRYAWFAGCGDLKKNYTVFDTTILRQGDIVERIPEAQRTNYPAALLAAQQVIGPDGGKYKPAPDAPIMLIGDSYTGVFELVDGKSAGVGAHIAQKTGLPVDILTGWGGGPMVMNKLLRTRKKSLGNKRLVIFMMTARDLYNYSQGWEKLSSDK
jgi:hypothetical protein